MDWCLETLLWNYTGSAEVGDIGCQVYVTSCYQQTTPETSNLFYSLRKVKFADESESICISQLEEESCGTPELEEDGFSSEEEEEEQEQEEEEEEQDQEETLSSFDDLLDKQKNECHMGVENEKTQTDPETNVYYDDKGPAVCLTLKYDSHVESLDVTVMECRGLPVVDERKHPLNPYYVKSYLVIANIRYGKMKTKTISESTSPKFCETFRYCVTKSSLMGSELLVAVWHYSKYGRNFCIGHTTIRLDEVCFRDPSSQWFKLQQTEEIYHPCFLI
uniref:Synaptotagmin-like protein 5 isoform X2 n=1 Tax=Crassostrea virginica TaxID=6565 RepID=A0A8B8DDD8_CRAVI|nr:synaptotagmin-like protein 5 isoform X2 [Crassostrea virginica]